MHIYTYAGDQSLQVLFFFLIQEPGFQDLSSKFQYPEECSQVIVQGVQRALFIESYRSKFHMLVHLEELERSRKIIKE